MSTDDWFEQGRSGAAVDVAALMDGKAADGLWTMVQSGALVSVGRTGDGGALGVTITVDGRYRREYFRDADDLADWLAEAIPAVNEACEAAAASSARRQRKRGL